jgi:hypothetical protein
MPYDIRVAGDKDMKRIENHDAGTKLKNLWIQFKEGKTTNKVIEVGLWAGELSDIKSFTMVTNISQAYKPQNEYKELTPEQMEKNRLFMIKLKETYKKIRLNKVDNNTF